jgi:hypothetical protein
MEINVLQFRQHTPLRGRNTVTVCINLWNTLYDKYSSNICGALKVMSFRLIYWCGLSHCPSLLSVLHLVTRTQWHVASPPICLLQTPTLECRYKIRNTSCTSVCQTIGPKPIQNGAGGVRIILLDAKERVIEQVIKCTFNKVNVVTIRQNSNVGLQIADRNGYI